MLTLPIPGQARPFMLGFKTDADENTIATDEKTNEQANAPGGIVGFSLNFAQQSCT